MKNLFLIPLVLICGTASWSALAQDAVSYTSPIADYQSFNDEKVAAWKLSNDKVGQIGGWRAYAKEAQQPDNMPTLAPIQKTMGGHGEAVKIELKTEQKQ